MHYLLSITFLLLPSLAFCQALPIKKLQALGLTEAEIDSTAKLNGENGVNGYYVLARIKENYWQNKFQNISVAYELYTPKGKTIQLIDFKGIFWQSTYFDILDDYVIIIEGANQRASDQITISRFKLNGKLEQKLLASIPCHYTIKCDWIEQENKLIALYNMEDRTKPRIVRNGVALYTGEIRSHGSVHEYNWQTGETILLYDKVPLDLDAGFRGYTALTYIVFNKETSHFEYFQE